MSHNLLQLNLVRELPLERHPGRKVGGLVEPFDCGLELGGFTVVGQQLCLQCSLHATIIDKTAHCTRGNGLKPRKIESIVRKPGEFGEQITIAVRNSW